ncbi:MAG: glutathione S-transferase N-terminal domain-containing protein [Candidatus Aenigmarchaeota archaeon]|nr:glutathione S-transferase N-terminal domain-containing protein [Candidatus Aenigmarchaeota archaeon]
MKVKNVTIYTAKWCPWCQKAKAYFRQNNISFVEKDVESDEKYGQEVMHKSGQLSIPVIDIDGTIIVGFDRPAIDRALGLAVAA